MENSDVVENLPEKPLEEAIFELRWGLNPSDHGRQHDPGFKVLYGRFYDKISEHYPFTEDLDASRVPEDMLPHVVRHRFRPSEGIWPVVQIGPGIMTVNDTEAYTWAGFAPRVKEAIQSLFGAYPSRLHELVPTVAQLTYINAILFDASKENLADFLRENLHLTIDIDSSLFENQDTARKPRELNLHLAFPLIKPSGTGIFRVTTGLKNQDPALVWQIIIHAGDDMVPKDTESLGIWLEDAHEVAEKWFFTLIRGRLRKVFGGVV